MAKISRQIGQTSLILQIFIPDASQTDGRGLAGLVFNTASLTAYYKRNTANAAVAISLVTATLGTYTSGGFKEIDATNMPGWYELHIPNAALASGADSVAVHLKGATNMVPVALEIELTAVNNQDAVRGGMTALPNANAGANGGLPTGDASARVTLTPTTIQGIWDALTSALTTSGSIGKRIADNLTGDAYVRIGAPAGASVSADVAAIYGTVDTEIATLVANVATILAAVDTEVAAIKAKTDNLPAAPAAVGDIPTVSNILTTVMTESYPAYRAAPTLAQILFELRARLMEASASGTTLTIKKIDGSTTAETLTMNDSSNPTSITRAT